MWTETAEGRAYVEEVSRCVVDEVAPEELDLFGDLMAEYFADPTPPAAGDVQRDDALGFGLGEALIAVTPAAAAMVTAVLAHVLAEAGDALKEESGNRVKDAIKRLFNPEKEEAEKRPRPQPLSTDQMKQVRRIARREAIKFGLDPDVASKMATALIGALALAA